LLRLRIAACAWIGAYVNIAGQDNAFISPLSPTSFASLAVPTFGYAGNLWGWIPQVRVEHRFDISDGHNVTVQGGILDNLVASLHTQVSIATRKRESEAGSRPTEPGSRGPQLIWPRNDLGAADITAVRTGAFNITWMVGRV